MKDKSEIQNYLIESIERGVFCGCHVFIMDHGKSEYFIAGDKSVYPYKEINDSQTIYDLASLTKVLVTTPLILKLIEQNKLSLNQSVQSLLPLFQCPQVTIEHLLTHTSGLPADTALPMGSHKPQILEAIYKLTSDLEPGKQIIYSDLGFILLGEIIETITKRSLAELSKEWLFLPMEMRETSYLPDPAWRQRCAPTENSPVLKRVIRGEVHDRKCRMMQGISGHAGLFSTIYDLSHYAKMLLDGGKYKDRTILEPKSIALLYQNRTPNVNGNRGIGFINSDPLRITPFHSKRAIMHTGFTGTSIMVDFDLELAVIVLSNRIHPTRDNSLILEWRNQFYEFLMK
ncbi:MAG: serine hydrolase domain-containing protein [Beduini sp.]|uniref:serine hydrolase domain-containing protein n=1 Tax=Beduini sp. TaxID=1922300 RepID=UPI0039A3569A